ncbi:MAG: hypothetical protein M0Z53_00420 [Thermaerobacter sp.]|nr:hypothetical protein [Thermaerobacter sp.]
MEERCPICGSEDIVTTGPLTVEGPRAMMTVVHGRQCILCGNLQVMVPQALLVRLYPPGLRYLTQGRRARLQNRRKVRRRAMSRIT